MELMQIVKEWKNDSVLDESDLGGEAIKIPKLHCKYYEMFIKEKMLLEKLKIEVKSLEQDLWRYYSGMMSHDELKEHDFEILQEKYLRQDIPRQIEGSEVMIGRKKQIATQQEKCEFLKSILDQVKSRSFVVRDAIEWEKFKQGA